MGCRQDPFFSKLPQKWFSNPSGDHIQFMRVFKCCFELCRSGACPTPILSPLRSCRKSRLASGSREDNRLSCRWAVHCHPRQPRQCHTAWDEGHAATSAEVPQPEAARPSAGGLWCQRPGVGWLSIPGSPAGILGTSGPTSKASFSKVLPDGHRACSFFAARHNDTHGLGSRLSHLLPRSPAPSPHTTSPFARTDHLCFLKTPWPRPEARPLDQQTSCASRGNSVPGDFLQEEL